MSATRAVRYDCDPSLPFEQQYTLGSTYRALVLGVFLAKQSCGPASYTARNLAADCRRLIATFGVRRDVRLEFPYDAGRTA
jgi:hypothetical protein